MMKTEINHLFDLLTCQFLKVIFSTYPQIAWTIPILISRMPLLPISSFTKSFKIYLTLRIFCQFSYPGTCHLPPDTFQYVAPDFRNAGYLTRKTISPPRKAGSLLRTAVSPGFPAGTPASASPDPSPAALFSGELGKDLNPERTEGTEQ